MCQVGERPIAYDLALAEAQQATAAAAAAAAAATATAAALPAKQDILSTASEPVADAAGAAPPAPALASAPASAPASASTSTSASDSAAMAAPAPPKRKRRRAARKALQNINSANDTVAGPAPSASHYVGYVEEGETVDMIMRKFAQLDDFQREKRQKTEGNQEDIQGITTAGSNEDLTEEDMVEMFARTSNFTMNQAQKSESAEQREMLARQQARGESEDGMLWQNAAGFLNLHRDDQESGDIYWDGEVDEDEFWDDVYTGTHRRKKKKQPRIKVPRTKKAGSAGVNIAFVSDANGKYVTALRRVRGKERTLTRYVRVPKKEVSDRRWGALDPEIPFSWAKQIVDYVPPRAAPPPSSYVSSHPNLLDAMCNVEKINPLVGLEQGSQHQYLAVMMTPPWKDSSHSSVLGLDSSSSSTQSDSSITTSTTSSSSMESSLRIEPKDLLKLPLNNPEWKSLVFAFVWVRKDLISKVCDAMAELHFYYVESLCWVKQQVNNTMARQPSPYICTTHETLLMFRRGKLKKEGELDVVWTHSMGTHFEMRHQRTEDVCFDFVRPLPGSTNSKDESKPDQFCYNMVERLLPHSVHEEIEGSSDIDGNGGKGTRLGKTKDKRPLRKRGLLIHLWSENRPRQGWTMLHQPFSGN